MPRTRIYIKIFYDLNLIPRAMVQGHCTPFPKTENGQIRPRGEKISIQVILDGQTDGMTDGLITIERPQSGALIRNLQYWSFDILITTQTRGQLLSLLAYFGVFF